MAKMAKLLKKTAALLVVKPRKRKNSMDRIGSWARRSNVINYTKLTTDRSIRPMIWEESQA
jgi:hypothetical protein